MAIEMNIESAVQAKPRNALSPERQRARDRLQQAFSDWHAARSTITSTHHIDHGKEDEIIEQAMDREEDALRRIIGCESVLHWQVWLKFDILDYLLSEEGGGMDYKDKRMIRLIGSIKADLAHLTIGKGEDE